AGDGPHGYDEQGARIFGADAAALLGASGKGERSNPGTWYEAIHEADQAAYLAAELRRKEEGRPYTIEYRIRHPDTAAERWMREVAWVVDAPEDDRRYLDSYIIDITEEKLAALALQESELRLQLALSAGGMGTWDVDLRTGDERWNDVHYRLFGVDPKTFTPSSETFLALVDPRDRAEIEKIGEDVIAGRIGPSFTNDYRIVLPYGGVRWIGGGGRLIREADGTPARLLGVSFDITERMERERALQLAHAQLAEQAQLLADRNRELEAASHAKDRFVASVSHELRTPMNAVLGFAELLAASGLTEAQERYVQVIRATGKQLLTRLNDVLDMAKIEAGRLDLEQIDFPLSACLEQVRSLLAPQASERGLELVVASEAPADLVLQGDPTRLSQILVNLVGNGIKFTAKGSVTLRVVEKSADDTSVGVRFEIQDTGIGISPERVTELFRPFVQADSSIARNYGGTGLGLAICRSLVEAMAGTIGVVSELGGGSLFWFEIPFRRGAPAVRPSVAKLAPQDGVRLRILVADDVLANRELLGEMLRMQGHEVLFAEDGRAAVTVATTEKLDLILMDVQMPVMDGIEATRRIRQLPPPHGAVAIYALTAHAMAPERARCLSAGMSLCLTKPIIWPDLFAALAPIAARSAGTPSEAPAPRLAPVSTVAAMASPLLDRAVLQELQANIPAPQFQGLVGRALTGIEDACARMAPGDRWQLAQEAHRLRGTAGSFGFRRIAAVAGLLEEQMAADGDPEPMIADLKTAARETRDALGECLTAEALTLR
ncbi:MAG: ATP-binding protein, partial [Geminicoccaceae bacterium]